VVPLSLRSVRSLDWLIGQRHHSQTDWSALDQLELGHAHPIFEKVLATPHDKGMNLEIASERGTKLIYFEVSNGYN
jgi:hypothetical protein